MSTPNGRPVHGFEDEMQACINKGIRAIDQADQVWASEAVNEDWRRGQRDNGYLYAACSLLVVCASCLLFMALDHDSDD